MLLTTNDCAVDAVEFVSMYQKGNPSKLPFVLFDSSKMANLMTPEISSRTFFEFKLVIQMYPV